MTGVCSDCGEPGATHCTRDASGRWHVFHEKCYAALVWWLEGNDGTVDPAFELRVVREIRRDAKNVTVVT